MTEAPVIDGEAEDVSETRALVPVTASTVRSRAASAPTALAVTPQVKASELVERLAVIREAQDNAMVADVDYGLIPGTNKPTLLKPGAEKLSVLFQLDVQLDNEKAWGPGDHLTVMSHATVFHAPSGARLGYGEGICSTRERKYGKRKANRTCPNCNAEAIRTSKNPAEGFYCWRKINGCGAQFPRDDDRITSQFEGEIDNPDLPDQWNTVVKMAEKRARVDAILAVTGASALFTQDAEDNPQATTAPHDPAAENAPAPAGPRNVNQEEINRIYDAAGGKLTGRQLLLVLLEANGKPTEHTDEHTALARISDVIRTVPAAKVPDVLAAIEAVPQ